MTFTMRQRLLWTVARRVAPVLLLGVLLGFAGPFGSYPPLTAPVRYSFWIAMVLAGYAAALAVEKLVPETSIQRPELRLVAVALASALPVTFVAAWVIPFVRPGHLYQPLQLPVLFAAVAAVQLAITFTLLRKSSAQPQPTPGRGSDSGSSLPRALLSRLPNRLGDEIVALQAEDHYLRVHTILGSDLILMRLSDAVAAIGPDLGLQVHRSWWVAHDAICEVIRSEQRLHPEVEERANSAGGSNILGGRALPGRPSAGERLAADAVTPPLRVRWHDLPWHPPVRGWQLVL